MKSYLKAPELLQKQQPADLGLVYTSVQRIEVSGEVTV